MWKLWNKLFGWDYVLFQFGNQPYIRRIVKTPKGVEYVKIYGTICVVGEAGRNWIQLT
jgi:hypothetical protein